MIIDSFLKYLPWSVWVISIIICIKKYRDIEYKHDDTELMKKKFSYLAWASGIFFIGGAWLAHNFS